MIGHSVTGTGRIQARFGGRVIGIDVGMGDVYGGNLAALEVGPDGSLTALYPDRARSSCARPRPPPGRSPGRLSHLQEPRERLAVAAVLADLDHREPSSPVAEEVDPHEARARGAVERAKDVPDVRDVAVDAAPLTSTRPHSAALDHLQHVLVPARPRERHAAPHRSREGVAHPPVLVARDVLGGDAGGPGEGIGRADDREGDEEPLLPVGEREEVLLEAELPAVRPPALQGVVPQHHDVASPAPSSAARSPATTSGSESEAHGEPGCSGRMWAWSHHWVSSATRRSLSPASTTSGPGQPSFGRKTTRGPPRSSTLLSCRRTAAQPSGPPSPSRGCRG